MRRKLWVAPVVLGGLLVLAALVAAAGFVLLNEPFAARAKHTVGLTEAEVRHRLGAPTESYTAARAPERYYLSGYDYEPRKITNKVLIYLGGFDGIAYIYLGSDGKVEHVYVGGS